jgi:hypothetical protein
MNASKLLLIAAAAGFASFGAVADEADASQYVVQFNGTRTRAEVQAELLNRGPNVFSIQYNPVASFQGERTRAQVQADYLASRSEVAALTGEDSGSAFLAQAARTASNATRIAGQPHNAQ